MTGTSVTRGYGLLENYLNRRRCAVANRLIPSSLRKGRILDIGCGTFPSFPYSTSFAVNMLRQKASKGIDCRVADILANSDLVS